MQMSSDDMVRLPFNGIKDVVFLALQEAVPLALLSIRHSRLHDKILIHWQRMVLR